MFEEIKTWLESMNLREKRELIDNLKLFMKLKSFLIGKSIVVVDPKNNDLLIIKDHEFVKDFLKVYNKLTMKGVKVVDKRKAQSELFNK